MPNRSLAASLREVDAASTAPRSVAILAALALAILLVPVWSVTVPPLNDYPNHLARMFVFTHLDGDAYLQKMYEVHAELVPDLAIDAIVPPLSHIMSLYDAGRVFVSLILFLWVVGPVVLHYALYGRWSLWPLAAGFVACNACFIWGFANFLFGTGLVFFAFAAWILCEAQKPLVRFLVFTLIASALYCSHLLALAAYGICIAAYELGQVPQDVGRPLSAWLRRWIPAAGQFAVPAILFLFVSPSGSHFGADAYAGLGVKFTGLWRLFEGLRAPTWAELGVIDYVALAFLGAVIGIGLLTRRLVPHRRIVPVLIVLGGAAGFLALFHLSIDDVYLHIRYTPVFVVLLIAGSAWQAGRSRRLLIALFGVGAALFVGRVALLADQWAYYDRQFTEFRRALAVVPPGSAIFGAALWKQEVQPPRLTGSRQYPYEFITELAIIERSAFAPRLFTFGELQILRLTPAYRPIGGSDLDTLPWEELPAHTSSSGTEKHFQDSWPEHFDYVAALHPAGQDDTLKQWLIPVHRGSFFTIFRIVKPAGAPTMAAPVPAR